MKNKSKILFISVFFLIIIFFNSGCILPNIDNTVSPGSNSCPVNNSQVSIQINGGTTVIYDNEYDPICTPCLGATLVPGDIQIHYAHGALFPDNGDIWLFIGAANSSEGIYEIGDAAVVYVDYITGKDYTSFDDSGLVWIQEINNGYIFGTYTGSLRYYNGAYEYIDVNIVFNVKIIN